MLPRPDQDNALSWQRFHSEPGRLCGVVALAAVCLIGSSVNVSGDDVEAQPVDVKAPQVDVEAQPVNEQAISYTNGSGQQVLVFNNDLLDRRFGAQRAAPNKEPVPNERATKESTASSTGNSSGALLDAPQRPTVAQSVLAPAESFTALIGTSRSAKTAAALRFAEKGRQTLKTGDPARALINFERALSLGLGPYVPYVYLYLAQAHSQLGHVDAAQDFTTAAQAWFDGDSGFAA